jgi:protoporphyrinogen oxidase
MRTVEKDAPAVVLGAGPAGLAAGFEFARSGHKVVVIERQPYLGGLSTTFQHDGYRLDLGPHAFHYKNDEVDVLFRELSSHGYRDINMKASLLLHGKYFDYPLKFGQALLRLEPTFTARMMFDYAGVKIRNLFSEMPEDSFEAWGIKRYGRTMYDMAFGNYSRKVWGMPTTQLSKKLAQQKLPDLSLRELIKEALGGRGAKQKILYSSYAYPNNGIGIVFESMGDVVRREGGRVLLGVEPVKFLCRDNKVVAVDIEGGNGPERIPCSVLVNTIPLNNFMRCFGEYAGEDFIIAARKLIYRHLMLAYIEIEKANITNEIMVYLLDTDFTFNRIGEQKNLAPEMIPVDRSMLCFEICTDENDKWWNMSDEEFVDVAKQDLLKLGTVSQSEIRGGFVKRIKQAYPIYDLTFDRNLSTVLEMLKRLENVYSIGRQGLFLNNDIHTSMKMGLEIANHYINREPRQTWNDSMHGHLNWRLA